MRRGNSSSQAPECRNASLIIVRLLVLHLAVAEAVLERVPAEVLLAICVYLTGLILGADVSATCFAQTLPLVSHDAITRMLSQPWWQRRQMIGAGVRLANAFGDGWLILDDVLIPKPHAKAIAFCGWDYDHASRRNTFGLRLVVLVWCNGSVTLPLGFVVWQKDPSRPTRRRGRKRGRKPKRRPRVSAHDRRAAARRRRTATGSRFRSKNELARSLVWEVVRAGCHSNVILFDNWYASRENIRVFGRLGLRWATRLKKNTKVVFEGQHLTVAELASIVTKANYHYYASLGARARSFSVTVLGVEAQLTVVQNDTHPERDRTKYLVSNLPELTTVGRVEWYRRRWPIECFFRDCKQLLGLCGCQARIGQAILTHIVLVCVAYVVLQLVKPLSLGPRLSVNRSRHALVALRVLASPQATARLVRLTASGRFDPVELEHVWTPVRTRLPGVTLPKTLEFP